MYQFYAQLLYRPLCMEDTATRKFITRRYVSTIILTRWYLDCNVITIRFAQMPQRLLNFRFIGVTIIFLNISQKNKKEGKRNLQFLLLLTDQGLSSYFLPSSASIFLLLLTQGVVRFSIYTIHIYLTTLKHINYSVLKLTPSVEKQNCRESKIIIQSLQSDIIRKFQSKRDHSRTLMFRILEQSSTANQFSCQPLQQLVIEQNGISAIYILCVVNGLSLTQIITFSSAASRLFSRCAEPQLQML